MAWCASCFAIESTGTTQNTRETAELQQRGKRPKNCSSSSFLPSFLPLLPRLMPSLAYPPACRHCRRNRTDQ
eukprot:755738-Hanusia_phi.AAC.2